MKDLLREFRPALSFLGRFLMIYVLGNLLYGLLIESFGDRPDPFTIEIARETSSLLQILGERTSISPQAEEPIVTLQANGKAILDVYEGCNAINVVIIFVAFLFAFGGPGLRLVWFMPLGLALIHLTNLGRIVLLYFTVQYRPADFYYFHKFLFTGILYILVFLLWMLWVFMLQKKKPLEERVV